MADLTQQAFQWNSYQAFIGVSGTNLLPANWGTNDFTGGPSTGWNNVANSNAYQNAGSLGLHLAGFTQNIVTTPTIPFDSLSWALTNDVPGNQAVPSEVCEMPTRFGYMPSLGYAIARIANPNIGATDTAIEAAAMMTIRGAQRPNTRLANCH